MPREQRLFLERANALAGAMRPYNMPSDPVRLGLLGSWRSILALAPIGLVLESILSLSADLSGLRALYKCR